MNLLLEIFVKDGLLIDALGILGLGLVSLAAIQLAKRHQARGGHIMAIGAVFLLLARLYVILAPHFMTNDVLQAIGPIGISITIGAPPLLLSFGLTGIVWGLWGHQREVAVKAR